MINDNILAAGKESNEDDLEIMGDINYIRKSSTLVTEALHKGCDVIQMANGDVYITETKTITFHYTWDSKKGKMIRVNSSGRVKRARKKHQNEDILNAEDILDDLHNETV